jgi:hypothetical protein
MLRFTHGGLRQHSQSSRFVDLYLVVSLLIACACAGCANREGGIAVLAAQSSSDSLAQVPQVGPILANSCFDCHSHDGSGAIAAKMAPSYLFGAAKARQELDLSDWTMMSADQRRVTANAIAHAVENGSMPPGDYLTFHPSAELSDKQKRIIAAWATNPLPDPLPAH